MRKHIALIIAILGGLAAPAIAQPGIGITKTAPLSGKGSVADPLKITICANGEAYQSNGTSWACATMGDITSVGATSNMGLTGGSVSGAALLGLLSTCANGQVLESGASGTTWTCADDNDTTYSAGSGLSLTGGVFAVDYTSDFQITGGDLDLSTAVTAPGTLSTADGLTAGDAAADSHTINGSATLSAAGRAQGFFASSSHTAFATGDHYGIRSATGGTFDTTAGTELNVGFFSTANGSRSAGANPLWNVGYYASASGGQLNNSFYGAAGDFYNAGAGEFTGNTTLGDASTDTVYAPGYAGIGVSPSSLVGLYVNGSGRTYSLVTQGALARFENAVEATSSIDIGGAMTVDGNTTLGDAASDTTSTVGTVSVTSAATAQSASRTLISVADSGTFTTAAADRVAVGVDSLSTNTVSTGTNTLYSIAVRGRANTNSATLWETAIGVYGSAEGTNTFAVGVYASASGTNSNSLLAEDRPVVFSDASLHTFGTAPAATSCGSSPTVTGTNQAGKIITGSGATGCILTFHAGTVWLSNDVTCVVTARSGTQPSYTPASTTLTLNTAAASATYDYWCTATSNGTSITVP
jgi:hypothetical protein